MEMNDATERKVEEGKQEIFTLRRVPSAKLARLGTNLAQCLLSAVLHITTGQLSYH